MDFASSVVAVVSRGHHRPADTSRVVDEQLVGGEASEAESGRSATVDLPAADRPVMSAPRCASSSVTTTSVKECRPPSSPHIGKGVVARCKPDPS